MKKGLRADPHNGWWMTGYIFACYVRTLCLTGWRLSNWELIAKGGMKIYTPVAYGEHVLWLTMNLALRPIFGVNNISVVTSSGNDAEWWNNIQIGWKM